MTAPISGGNRARFAADAMMKGTPQEPQAAFKGYVVHFGRYESEEAEGIVHHVERFTFPSLTGSGQRRADLAGG